MPRVAFTANLQRYLSCPALVVAGSTVHGALEEVFAANPILRGYVLDDQGCLRRHVTVFVDAQFIADRDGLSDAVRSDSEIFIAQALSGG